MDEKSYFHILDENGFNICLVLGGFVFHCHQL